MDFILNDVNLRDARKQMGQAREVERLTLLAYFFLSLSFVSSVFGMNFVEFKDWKATLGMVLGAFFLVMGISLVMLLWDYMPWRRDSTPQNELA